jgi:hypothetical protein
MTDPASPAASTTILELPYHRLYRAQPTYRAWRPLVAIVMTVVRQYRAAQLTASRGALSVSLGLGIMALAGLGIVALSPVAAQASVTPVSSTTSSSSVDIQLATLSLDD